MDDLIIFAIVGLALFCMGIWLLALANGQVKLMKFGVGLSCAISGITTFATMAILILLEI